MKRNLFSLAGAVSLALIPAPALAQDDADNAAFAAMAEMFEVEPLTPEQQSRLPAARQLVALVMPEGVLSEMMGGMYDGLLGPMMDASAGSPNLLLGETLGHANENLIALSDEEAEEALAIVDPSWRERQAVSFEAMERVTSGMMAALEPTMRNVMAELYAINFTEAQLGEIGTFFETDAGAQYARKSYTMANDPRIMAAIFSDPDLIMGSVGGMMEELEAAENSLPPRRSYSDLTPAQRGRLAKLTGLSDEELEQSLLSDDQ